MTMVDFPKIDSQGFFHDWNGFAMVRFNDPHLPSAGFTRRGVILYQKDVSIPLCVRIRGQMVIYTSPSIQRIFDVSSRLMYPSIRTAQTKLAIGRDRPPRPT